MEPEPLRAKIITDRGTIPASEPMPADERSSDAPSAEAASAAPTVTSRPDRLLLCLHGHDATEHDLTAVAPLLDPGGHFLVAGARGPLTTDGGRAAWFTSGPRGPDPDAVTAVGDAVRATVAALCAEHDLRREHTVLLGFSQGGATALAVALTSPDSASAPAGVLCLSGFLLDEPGLAPRWETAAATAVLVQHGDHDEVVPVELGHATAMTLAHHGLPVVWQRYPMGHQTTLESLLDARDWLTRIRAGDRPSAPVDPTGT
jgi:phospholipase/carboxylesterase